MPLIEEIRIHDPDENCTSVGSYAIRLSLNRGFHKPTTPGFHLFDRTGNLHKTETNYEEAGVMALHESLIIIWREDLTTPQFAQTGSQSDLAARR